jgi:hypothetical protein
MAAVRRIEEDAYESKNDPQLEIVGHPSHEAVQFMGT